MKTIEITTKVREMNVGEAVVSVEAKHEALNELVKYLVATVVRDMKSEGRTPIMVTVALGVEASVLTEPPTEGGAA